MKKHKTPKRKLWLIIVLVLLVAFTWFDNFRSSSSELRKLAIESENDIFCMLQKENTDKEKCLKYYAYHYNSSESCLKIDKQDTRDSCLVSLLFLNNQFECSYIDDAALQSSCEAMNQFNLSNGYDISELEVELDI